MRPRIALDARLTRQLSAGMQTYVRELTARLPAAAPDLEFANFTAGGNFGWAEHVRLPLAIRAAKPALTHYLSQYTPLLESHDAGEQGNKGGLVVAKVGKGTWIYCSYSFFRQLPAGVPGAYRLFDNLLSLPKAR